MGLGVAIFSTFKDAGEYIHTPWVHPGVFASSTEPPATAKAASVGHSLLA
ncbi:MAG: hypothetical protein QXT46_03990 [Pyrobaculum sp.]